jgi:hypothetical protein
VDFRTLFQSFGFNKVTVGEFRVSEGMVCNTVYFWGRDFEFIRLGLGFRVQGLGFRVLGLGFRVYYIPKIQYQQRKAKAVTITCPITESSLLASAPALSSASTTAS